MKTRQNPGKKNEENLEKNLVKPSKPSLTAVKGEEKTFRVCVCVSYGLMKNR